MSDEPTCDGQCRPDLFLYHARCPLHGAPLWGLVLDIEASNSAERRERSSRMCGNVSQ